MKTLNQKATRAGIYYTIANMFLKGCVFLTLPLFTRILSTNDFVFTDQFYFVALSVYIIIIWHMKDCDQQF